MNINQETWPSWSKIIAAPDEPIDNSPTAIDRLMTTLDDYIIRVKGVKPQFHAKNRIELISFTTTEGREFYESAVERYKERILKAENDSTLSARDLNVIKLVAFLQYRIAAESNPDRIDYLCREMVKAVREGKASCCAVNFRTTIIACVKHLRDKYGVDRNNISLIWGGGQTEPTKKQKAKAVIEKNEDLIASFKKYGISMSDINLEDVEAKAEADELDPTLRLGTQTLKERQIEIDRFQKGKSLYCFYTFRAGGVGLSLHHTDEFTKEKVRHKESGYAFEEDISKISTRPRKTFVAPTWSAIELVQGLGRVPRITSLSDTEQLLIFFQGTVEMRVAMIVSAKLKCLTKVVRQKESWEGMILGHESEDQKYLDTTTDSEEEADVEGSFFGEDENDNNNNGK